MTPPSKSLLFFTPFGYWQVHNQLDLAVASSAAIRGYSVTYITCDAFYQPCAMERGQVDCDTCQSSMHELTSLFAISGEPLGSLVKPEDVEKAETWVLGLNDLELVGATYEDLEIGEWALSTVMTHFRFGDIADLYRSVVIPIHRRFLRDTLLTYWAIEQVIDRDRIDAVFLFNGRFYPYRAALEASRRHSCRVLVHERGRLANSFSFFENEGCLSTQTSDQVVSAWAAQPLSHDELKQVDRHFSQLLLGRSPHWPSFYDQVKPSNPRAVLGIPADAKIVGFFSSSSDEIASQISFAKITSQFALIEDIASILDKAGIYLVVRHHPHIGGGPVGSPVEPSALMEAYARSRSRRSNVRIVMPKDEIPSYALFPYLTAAIAPFTSLGLETTAFGIPTLVADGSIAAFDKRYTIDEWSVPALDDKIAFLMSSSAELDGERFRSFYRTFYSRFHRFSLRFNVVAIEDYIMPFIRLDSADVLQPNRDQALDRVLSFLIDGQHIHERPAAAASSTNRSTLWAEDEYIVDRLKSIKMRSRGQPCMPQQGHDESKNRIAILCEESPRVSSATANLRGLPNSDRISILPFFSKPLNIVRRLLCLTSRGRETRRFKEWSRGLLVALDKLCESHVLVVSERHQLHDASIATIISHFAARVSDTRQIVALSGWFGDTTQFLPQRVSASTLTRSQWSQMQKSYSGKLRGQDVLSLCIVEKNWLRANLKSADELQIAVFDHVDRSDPLSAGIPIFLWQ